MPGGWWWECEKCSKTFDFQHVCDSENIASFIQDKLRKNWNQDLLIQKCPKCRSRTLRIAYEFPREKREHFRVYHIVGIVDGEFIPMMFETKGRPKYKDSLFDFKYIVGRSPFGLNKAAVFSKEDLKELFKLYCKKTGMQSFP